MTRSLYDEDDVGDETVGYGAIGGEAEDMLRELSGVSGEEIIGLEEIIGAMPPTRARNAALAKLAQAKANAAARRPGAAPALPTAGTRVDIVPIQNRRHRLLIAGVGPTAAIASLATLAVQIQPQRTFKPKLLSVPSSIALYFALDDVKVGQDSQFATSNQVPCECFSEVAVNAEIDWDTANIGNTITLLVVNIDTTAPSRIFRALIKGLAVKP